MIEIKINKDYQLISQVRDARMFSLEEVKNNLNLLSFLLKNPFSIPSNSSEGVTELFFQLTENPYEESRGKYLFNNQTIIYLTLDGKILDENKNLRSAYYIKGSKDNPMIFFDPESLKEKYQMRSDIRKGFADTLGLSREEMVDKFIVGDFDKKYYPFYSSGYFIYRDSIYEGKNRFRSISLKKLK